MKVDAYFKDVENQLKIFEKTVKLEEKALKSAMEYILRSMVNYVKENGPWTDRTSNLRNSIGCNIKRARVIKSDENVNRATARMLQKPVVEVKGDDYVGVVSAGMEYAIHVELKSGYWVLQGAIDKFEPLIEKYFAEYMKVEKLDDEALFKRFVEDD